MKNILNSVYWPFRDLFFNTFPIEIHKNKYKYGFLVHPRDEYDVLRKYPFFAFIPHNVIRIFTKWYWPIVVTKVKGLKCIEKDQEIEGYIITIPLITKQILSNKKLAVKRIRQAIIMSRRMGIKIVGLGALTASVTRGGADLKDIKGIWITTGHAYTGYNVTRNLFKLEQSLKISKEKDQIAVVGAAGSIGSISAQIIARAGYNNILLIDLERKKDKVEETANQVNILNSSVNLKISYDIKSIKDSDFIIAATNTPEALITSEMLKSGAVVIDDAQPSDVHENVLSREDVLAIEAGVVDTPGVSSNFNLGLKGRFDNFCCMAEVLILAAHKWSEHFVVEKTNLEFVDKISTWGEPLKFDVAKLQNRKELISPEKFDKIKKIRQEMR